MQRGGRRPAVPCHRTATANLTPRRPFRAQPVWLQVVVRPYTPKTLKITVPQLQLLSSLLLLPPRAPLAPVAAAVNRPSARPQVDASGLPLLPDSLY